MDPAHGWREAVAHLMDACPGRMAGGGQREVRIEYGGGRPGTRSLYFARWIERALPGVNVTLIPVGGGPGVHSVVFAGCGAETSDSDWRRGIFARSAHRGAQLFGSAAAGFRRVSDARGIIDPGPRPGVRAGARA